MNHAFPLQTVLDVSNLRLDNAGKELGKLLASEMAASEKLVLLKNYRDEYQARFVMAAKAGLGPEEWNNHRAFLDRLEIAIRDAAFAHQKSQNDTQNGRDDWLNKRTKVKAIDALADRHNAQLVAAENRVEQKNTDERSSRDHHKEND
jgi:flagellar FliJ protein